MDVDGLYLLMNAVIIGGFMYWWCRGPCGFHECVTGFSG